jgi:hypothetical protein
MEFVPLVALGLVVKTTVDILRYLKGRDWNGAGTLLIAWVGGLAAAALFAQTDWADGLMIGDQNLGALNAASLVVFGLVLGSAGAFANEFNAARDSNRSTAKPHLVDDSTPSSG